MSIAEQVLRSADEIVSSRLNEVHFDKTEIATVLSKVKNKENIYWLNNGSIKYEANALNNSEYSDGSQVYVTIVNGDYNQDKVIIGSYDNTNDEPVYLYEDPFDRFGINTTIPIDIQQIVDDRYENDNYEFSLTALGTPTYIGAKVSLETNIENSVESYGFYIQLLANKVSEKEKPDEILYETVVDSRYITGNPYRLFSNMFHSFVFTLPNNFLITDVKSIRLIFYQDKNVKIDWKNITLFLGYDLKSDIIVNSEEQVFAATDALHSYYNVQTGKKEQHFQGFNEFLPNSSIQPSEQGEGTIKSLEAASDDWDFYSLATSENKSPTTENGDSVETQLSSWNDQKQEISSYLDWDKNGPIKNIGIYHSVIRFKANSTFIAKKLKDLKNGQSYKIKFQYYVDPEALFKDSGYVQNIGIYKVDESTNVGKYFYGIPNDQHIKGKAEKLAAAAGEWHEYSIDFIYDDKYTYYFGFEPSFNTNTIQDYCCLYVDNFQLFETIIVQPKEILGSWVKDGQVYSKNNLYPSQKEDGVEDTSSEEELPEISLQWYQYSPNHKDEGVGVAWKKLDNEIKWSLPIYIDIPLEDENGEQLKDDNGNLLTKKQWQYVDITKSEARFRLLIKYSDQEYKSNVLVLTNDGFQGAKSSVENGDLVLTLNDDGIYQYDHMAQLYADEEVEKILTASSRKGEDDLKPSNAIVWFIPKESTMIAPPTRKTKKKDNSDDVEYYYWDYYPEKHYDKEPQLEEFNDYVLEGRYTSRSLNSYYIIEKKCDDLSQNFRISKTYQPNYINNGIICYIYETDRDINPREGYRTTFTPQFVSANNNGIEASLSIKLVDDKGYFGGDNDKDIKLKGVVYDKNGQEIEEQPNVSWITAIANPLYLSTFNPGNATYDFNTGKVTITEMGKSFQTVFRANGRAIAANGQELGFLKSDSEHYYVYSIKVKRPEDDGGASWASRIDTLDFPYGGRNGKDSSTIVFEMAPTSYRRAGEFGYVYSENTEMTIHFVYTTEENNRPSNDKKHLLNRIIFKGFSQTGDSKVFTEFEETDYDIIEHTTANTTTYEDVKLNKEITNIYIKLFAGYADNNYGSAPYMNFTKYIETNNKPREFYLRYIHTNSSDGNNTSENNVITINQGTTAATTLHGYCEWNSETTGQAIQLSSYYAIPYFPTKQVYHLDGATQISYSSFGDNPKPSRSINYELYNWNGKTQGKEKSDTYFIEIAEENHPFKVRNDYYEKEQAYRHRIDVPTLAPAEEAIYILNIWDKPSISDDKKSIQKSDKSQLIAQYPIILLRNTYAFKEINAWGGSTVTTDNYVLSPMIGAGSKNNQNQFTGVIMGTSSEFPQTGLYGFKDGVATFGFKEDGSCFLGANEEAGRIEFNPNNKGGEMIINAKINRKGKFSFDKNYYYKTGTTELIIGENQNIITETYVDDTRLTGITFKLLDSTGYIGQLIGYDKNNDTDGVVEYRYLGMVIKSNEKLAIIGKEGVRLIYGTNGLGEYTFNTSYIEISDSIHISAQGALQIYGFGNRYGMNFGGLDNRIYMYTNRFTIQNSSFVDLLDLGADLIINGNIVAKKGMKATRYRATEGVVYLSTESTTADFIQITNTKQNYRVFKVDLSDDVFEVRAWTNEDGAAGIYWKGKLQLKFTNV